METVTKALNHLEFKDWYFIFIKLRVHISLRRQHKYKVTASKIQVMALLKTRQKKSIAVKSN
jgi:hypothetical protein